MTLASIPAQALIPSDLVVLNGVSFPIRSIHRNPDSVTLTLVGIQSDLFAIFRNHSLINVRPKR
ncbi:MAG: hypothetical protein JST84_05110 [Acidobacteria bacterium]|nr:hypothetical protein [Acidobacteriota bacterium]